VVEGRKKTGLDLEALSLTDLEFLAHRATRQISELRHREAYWSYKPRKFQSKWWSTEKPIVGLLCANKTGKTTYGIVRMLSACTGTKPTALGGNREVGFPEGICAGKRYLVMAETMEVLRTKTIIPKLNEYLLDEMLAENGRPNAADGDEMVYRFKSGAELVFMSYRQNRKAFEGSDFNGAWFDEPPPEPIWHAVRRGLITLKGWCVISATSLDEDWFQDQIVDPGLDEKHDRHSFVDVFQATMEMNCSTCSPDGTLDHDWIQDFAKSLDSDERSARIDGKVRTMHRVNFKYVTRETHAVPDFEVPLEWPIVEVIDPSETRGLWVGWFARDDAQLWYMILAKHVQDGAFHTMCEEIKRWRRQLRRAPHLGIMDTRGGKHTVSKIYETNWFDEFARQGLVYAPSEADSPLQTLHSWLEKKWQPEKEAEVPKLRFFRSVLEEEKGPLWALQRFKFDPEGTEMTRAAQYRQKAKDWVDVMKMLAAFPGIDKKFMPGKHPQSRPTQAESYSRRARRVQLSDTQTMVLGRTPRSGRFAMPFRH